MGKRSLGNWVPSGRIYTLSDHQVIATINEEDNNLELREVNSKGTFVTTFSPTESGMRIVRQFLDDVKVKYIFKDLMAVDQNIAAARIFEKIDE